MFNVLEFCVSHPKRKIFLRMCTSIAYAHICWWKSELPKWFIAVDSVVVVALRIYGILHKCDGALWLSWVWWKIIKEQKKCYYYLLAGKILCSQHNKSKKHKQILMWSTYNLHTRDFFFVHRVVVVVVAYILFFILMLLLLLLRIKIFCFVFCDWTKNNRESKKKEGITF